MKCLIILAHPNPKSFNNAIVDIISESLLKNKHEVQTRDLYALNFDPVLTVQELASLNKGEIPPDIKKEQEYVEWADILIVVYPVWWANTPAILRGYADRILSLGFAYKVGENGVEGLLTDKKALLFSTMGAPKVAYEKTGIFDSMAIVIDQEIFKYCGMKVIDHKYFGSVTTASDEERKQMLNEIKETVGGIS